MIRINQLRFDDIQREKGISNKELAERSATNPKTISNIRQKGICRYMTALRIARALGVDVKEIQVKDESEED